MNKQIGKNMFDGMELPEQTKQEVWGNLESIISNTTVEKGYAKTVFGSDGLEKQRLHSL